jgi:glycosyltransferase involved in cell wall biosynthesis
MRILLTSPSYPPLNSGLGNAVSQQAACFAQAGHEVVVATGAGQRGSREEEGIRVETFALTGADWCLQPIRGEVAAYTDFLRHNDWDVVLLNAWQNWATDLALRHLEEIPGRKFVYSHCISTNVFYPHQPLRSLLRYLAWRPYWRRLPRFMKRLDGMLFLSCGGSDSRFDDLHLAREYAVPLKIVPNNLSRAAVAILTRPPLPLKVRDRLMAVGSYQWQKGFDFVLRAYAASHARHRFALHLYGQEHSAYSATLRALVHQLGLREESVVFHEGISGEALVAAYCQARLVLSGSHTECQPLVLLDANAAGTPFVARTTGCIVTMPGGVAVRTWEEMARQLDALTEVGASWQSLADAGRQAAQDIYHPDHTARQLLDALVTLGVGKPAGVNDE